MSSDVYSGTFVFGGGGGGGVLALSAFMSLCVSYM